MNQIEGNASLTACNHLFPRLYISVYFIRILELKQECVIFDEKIDELSETQESREKATATAGTAVHGLHGFTRINGKDKDNGNVSPQ